MGAYVATVLDKPVYDGDDLAEAMRIFESAADAAAIKAGTDMIMYVMTPFLTVEAHATSKVGVLTGVSQQQWRSRRRQ